MLVALEKNFQKYIEICEKYLGLYEKQLELIKSFPKFSNPEFTEDEKWSGHAYIKENDIIRARNKMETLYDSIQREMEDGEKNLEILAQSETKLKFTFYQNISTRNWGNVNLKEYTEYLRKGLDIKSEALSEIVDKLNSPSHRK